MQLMVGRLMERLSLVDAQVVCSSFELSQVQTNPPNGARQAEAIQKHCALPKIPKDESFFVTQNLTVMGPQANPRELSRKPIQHSKTKWDATIRCCSVQSGNCITTRAMTTSPVESQ